MYHSEEVRRLAPEMDPLRLGMGWKLEDLEKPEGHYREHLWRQPSGKRASAEICGYSGCRCGSRRRPGRALFHNGYLRRHGTGP